MLKTDRALKEVWRYGVKPSSYESTRYTKLKVNFQNNAVVDWVQDDWGGF